MITVPKLHRPSRRLVKRVLVPLGLLALVVIAFMSSPFYHPALVRAAQRGDAEAVARAIARGANLDRRTSVFGTGEFNDWTALMWAAYARNDEVVRLLANAGADVNAQSGGGRTALHLVFYTNDPARESTIEVLLAGGADPNIATSWGDTPLLSSVRSRRNLASIALLIEAGADVNATDEHGDSVLWRALQADEHGPIPAVLRAHGANLVHVRPDGKRLYETPPASTEALPAPTDQVNAPAAHNANAPK